MQNRTTKSWLGQKNSDLLKVIFKKKNFLYENSQADR